MAAAEVRRHLVFAAHADVAVHPQVPEGHVVQSAPHQRRPRHPGKPGAVIGLAAPGCRQHESRLRRCRPQLPQDGQHAAGQGHRPPRQVQPLAVQVHLLPAQGNDLLQPQGELPRQPERYARRGSPLRLEQLPQGEFVDLGRLLPVDTGRDRLFFQILAEMDLQARRLHARHSGDVLPIVLLQLAENIIVPQIHQPHGGLALLVQGTPGQPGNGLGRQGFLIPVRQHHGL